MKCKKRSVTDAACFVVVSFVGLLIYIQEFFSKTGLVRKPSGDSV